MSSISKLFATQCSSHSHRMCKKINNLLIEHHNKNNNVDNDFLTRYLLYLDSSYDNFSVYSCLKNIDNWYQSMHKLLTYINPCSYDMCILAKTNHVKIIDLFKLVTDRNIIMNTTVLRTALSHNSNILAKYLVKYIEPNIDCLEIACKNSCDIAHNILDKKIIPNANCIRYSIQNDNINLLNSLLKYGGYPDENSLIEVCKKKNMKMLKLLTSYHIIPTQKCYQSIFDNLINTTTQQYIAEFIDVIISMGYKLNYKDVVYALHHKCYINNINKYDIVFEHDFMELCAHYRYYPYDNISIKPTMECLYIECGRKNNLAAIKKLIKIGLKPNIKCIRMACKIRGNLTTVRYFIDEHKILPDIECVKNHAISKNNFDMLYLIEKYEDNTVPLEVILNYNIKKHQREYTNIQINRYKADKLKIYDTDEKSSDNETKNVMNGTMGQKYVIKIPQKKEEPFDIKKYMKELEDNMSDEIKEYIAKIKKIKKIPKNRKQKIPGKILKLFGQEKNKKFTFIELRKLFMIYVIENKLCYEKDRTLIKPNKKLRTLLKMKETEYIKFMEIDDAVYKLLY